MKTDVVFLLLTYLCVVSSNVDPEDLSALAMDAAAHQLLAYNMSTKGIKKLLTVSAGAPVEIRDTNSLNDDLILNAHFLDSMTHLVREKIPERIVHAKGAGAFGYFEVTHDITKYCKAKLFEHVGKRTPIAARFSTSRQDRGSSDLVREPRGVAFRFYTEDGNWDMVGFNTPVYFYKDPQYFVGLIHANKKNRVTGVLDFNSVWDFLMGRPEALHEFMWVFSDVGIPDGYRSCSAFSIHAYELVNEHGESHFARLHFITDQGMRYLRSAEAAILGAQDADYSTRDLYNSIANGSYPSWSMYLELMTKKQVEEADFDPFDLTMLWPKDRYPLIPVGKLVLNRNPRNFFADVEQMGFNPANVVPGIPGAPDNLFRLRILAYRDTLTHRLGINHNKIEVNRPLQANTYNREGISPVLDDDGSAPSYYPNTFNGPKPYVDVKKPNQRYVALHSSATDLSQASYFYEQLQEDAKIRLVENVVENLSGALPSMQKRVIKFLALANADLSSRVSAGLAKAQAKAAVMNSKQSCLALQWCKG